VLARSVNEIIKRHEVLQTRLEGEPVQVIASAPITLSEVDLRFDAERKAEEQRLTTEEATSRPGAQTVACSTLGPRSICCSSPCTTSSLTVGLSGFHPRTGSTLRGFLPASPRHSLNSHPVCRFCYWQRQWLQVSAAAGLLQLGQATRARAAHRSFTSASFPAQVGAAQSFG